MSTFWNNKRVFVTGHTGFKGGWLCLWLNALGAQVHGYALEPPTNQNLFEAAGVGEVVNSKIADIRDAETLLQAMSIAQPDIVLHLAAQPLVRDSYVMPVETYSTNIMGTVNLLEAVRSTPSVKAVVNVTTDKCYENREWVWGYRESDPMGGFDPYSSSKGCSELITAAYRQSFFNPGCQNSRGVAIATARAGNVIGGGDWAKDRLIPDCMEALLNNKAVRIRNPYSIRPWQHVLEPLSGYLMLAEKLYLAGTLYAEAWNFGPLDEDARSVEWIVERMCQKWGDGASYEIDAGDHPHEANYLKLDCSKSRSCLGWKPKWKLEQALDSTCQWVKEYSLGSDARKLCMEQIRQYELCCN